MKNKNKLGAFGGMYVLYVQPKKATRGLAIECFPGDWYIVDVC